MEKGSGSGGIWHWNVYPGARVDTATPLYQLWDKELWEGFTFNELYPSWQELLRYFEHVEKKWDLKKDIVYDAEVTGAEFDQSRNEWLVTCANGMQVYAQWLIPAIGFAAKAYYPKIKGYDNFKGVIHHTAHWPRNGVDLEGKRIAVIGTGSSGVQVIQECAEHAKQLTVYQRTPNLALPMNQRKLDPKEEQHKKDSGQYEEIMQKTYESISGLGINPRPRKTFDDTPAQREQLWHELLIEQGGFGFWWNAYSDLLFDQKANDAAYEYWRKEVHKRMTNIEKANLVAPILKPHPWGTKRPALEQTYWEELCRNQVTIVDVNKTPILELSSGGVRTSDGEVEFDVIVLATGFDSVTGSLGQLDIRGTDGKTLAEHWAAGLRTSLGISVRNFPNMFFIYGPQGPTAFANGPSCTQVQAEWIEKTIKDCIEKGITRIEATEEAETDWANRTAEVWSKTLFPLANSWYQGSNIPGKRIEPLNW